MVVGDELDVLVHEGQLDGPVVRQVDLPPRRIVELGFRGVATVRSLLGIGALVLAEVEILRLVVKMAEGEAPALVQRYRPPRDVAVSDGRFGGRDGNRAADHGKGGSGRQKLAAIKT